MSSESERPIEKELRAVAARRAEAVPKNAFDLHPVTRNVLKVEVDRKFGRPGANAGNPGWWEYLWPRLAMAGGAMLLLAVLILSLVPPSPVQTDRNLAMTEPQPEPVNIPAPEPAGPPAARDAFAPTAVMAKSVSQSPISGQVVYQFYNSSQRPIPAASAERNMSVATSASPTPSTPRNATPSPVNTRPAVREASAAPSRFLEKFQVRLSGDQIEIVDLDQSTYRGRIQLIDPNRIAEFADTLSRESLGDSTDPAFPRNYRLYSERTVGTTPAALQFMVTGTNRTTRQTVEFSGRMLTWTQAAPATASSAPASLLQIQGNATLGGNLSQPINATTNPR